MLVATFVVAGLSLGYFRRQPEYVQYRLAEQLPRPWPQTAPGRRFLEVEVTRLGIAGREGEEALQRGTFTRPDAEGDLYVLDWPAAAIKKLSIAEGRIVAALRWIPDEADGYAVPPADFAAVPGGRVWAAYTEARTVGVFSPDGRLETTFELDVSADRIAADPGGGFVVLHLDGSPHLFRSYTAAGEVRADFGQMLAGDDQQPMLLDGLIAADGRGGFVYAPFFLDLIASFTLDGELRFLVETVDARSSAPLPRVLVEGGRRHRIEPGTPWQSLGLYVADDRIYVLSEHDLEIEGRILDVYAATDGAYVESIRLPDKARGAVVLGERLFTVEGGEIRLWRMLS